MVVGGLCVSGADGPSCDEWVSGDLHPGLAVC